VKCKRVQKMLADYVNETLEQGDGRRIQEHITGCETCRRELDILRSVLGFVDDVKVEYPPASVWDNFLPALHKRIANEAALVFKKQQRQRLYLLPGWAAVAAIVLIISVSAVLNDRSAIKPIRIQRANNTATRERASLTTTEVASESTLVAGIISELLITEAEAQKLKELKSAVQPETLVFPYGYHYDDDDDANTTLDSKEVIQYLEDKLAEFDEGSMMESDDGEFGAI